MYNKDTMRNVMKSHWVTGEDTVQLYTPVTKVDKENRLVSGFATLDNTDRQGDIVTAEASKEAFDSFRGNIREMHQPIAAGRVVDFKEDSYYDTVTKTFYRGIYVTAYVSKGAEDTWLKVLDGTLTGFSIGGAIKESTPQWSKDDQRTVRYVTKYDLIELSLVDSPANQLANLDGVAKIFTMDETENGLVMKGMAAEVEMQNIFMCVEHGVAKADSIDDFECPVCEAPMKIIGSCEKAEDTALAISDAIEKFTESNESNEGGVEVSDTQTEEKPATEEVAPVDDAAAVEDTEASDEVAEVDDAVADEPDIEKMLGDVKDTIKNVVGEVETKIEKFSSEAAEKTTELGGRIDNIERQLNDLKAQTDTVAKSLELLQGSTAIKKSVDVTDDNGGKEETTSFWLGTLTPGGAK